MNTTGYKTFTAGQPNNAPLGTDPDHSSAVLIMICAPLGTDPDQDCGGVTRTGLLDDLPCNSRYGFFCEMELPN
jgi:hypothetical protein